MSKNKEIILSNEKLQILNGCLLGDGTLEKQPCKSSNFSYSSSELDHVQVAYKLLSEFASPSCKNGPRKRKDGFRFRTQSNIFFYKLRQKWYPEGKKIIPQDLTLSPLTCLWWYLGDGHLAKKKQQIELATQCFNEVDIDFLVQKLHQLNFEAYKRRHRHQFAIIVPRRKVKQFLEYIGPCPVKCYNYKWDRKEYTGLGVPKKVWQFDSNDNFIKLWDSTAQVERETGYYQGYISECCLEKHKTAYGFKWKYLS